MNPNRFHDRQSFYKHATADTAKIILASGKLRWSVPSLFNDPFDVPKEILDGVDENRISNALVDRMNALVITPNLPHPEHHAPMTKMLLYGISKTDDELKKQILAANEESRHGPSITSEGLELLRKEWRSMYCEQRILCFTESWDSASMWDRYSQGHRGALLEFACLDHLDSAWLTAKPVNYTDDPLSVNTPAGLADLLFYEVQYAMTRIMEEYTHTKTTDWTYEKEWRLASWKRSHEQGEYSDYEFSVEELIGVTFGALMSENDKTEMQLQVKTKYPHVKLWQASIDSGRHMIRREVQ